MPAMDRYYDLLMGQMEAVRRTQWEKIATAAEWLETETYKSPDDIDPHHR